MKKLMIAAAIVCAAAMSQASSWNWAGTSGYLWDGKGKTADGGSKIKADATAYLFDAGTFSQQQLLTALGNNTYASVADAFEAMGVTTAAPIDVNGSGNFDQSANFDYGTGGQTYTYYAAIVADAMGDAVLITENTDPYIAPTTTGEVKPISLKSLTAGSQAALVTTGTFDGTHWYGASAVPEPTSGLLLLLGVAGLALRRRRA